jgi:hypothetical protein
MLDFNRMPRFKANAFEIFKMIPLWAGAFEVSQESILRQIPIAHAWADSNPSRAPRKNIIRFLFNWLTKAQKYGNLSAVRSSYKEHKPREEEIMTGEDFAKMRQILRA